MKKRLRKPTIIEANYFYLFSAFLLLIVGSMAQMWDINKGIIITEYLLILLPTVLYLVVRGFSLKKVLRLNKLSMKQIVLIPIITIFAYPIGIFSNYIMIVFLSLLGKIRPTPVPIPNTGMEYVVGLVIIAISAGICEEVMFRGLIMNSYERLGKWKAIIYSGILFGVFHFNLQNLFGPIFLGILFGYILIRTNSIFATMLAHATNNAVALTIGFLANKYLTLDLQNSSETIEMMNNVPKIAQLISYSILLLISGVVAVICGFILYFLFKFLPKNIDEKENDLEVISNGQHIKDISISKKVVAIFPLIVATLLFIYKGYQFITY